MPIGLNLDFVRKQFPALASEWVFFDNAGGSQVVKQVADRVYDYLLNTNVQLGATYDISRISTGRVDEAVREMAHFINAKEKCEVVLGPSTSMLIKNLSYSLAEIMQPGDEIVVTNCDHEANIGPWYGLERKGISVFEWKLNQETLELDMEDLDAVMSHKTRLVAVTHASNILGTINDIKKIAGFVHDRGAMLCVDGVAYAPHRLIDVQKLDVDFYAFSFYKVYGPHTALLYVKKNHLENIPGINHFFLENRLPDKLQPGHVNYELSYGLLGVRDYFMELAREHNNGKPITNFHQATALAYDCVSVYEEKLSALMLDFLSSKKNVRVIGKTVPNRDIRVPTFSFVVDGINSSRISTQIDPHKIGIRFGDFYARRLIDDLGLARQDGVVRVSMVHYNTREEVERLVQILDPLI